MSEVSTLPQGSDPVTHDELGTVLVASGIASTASQTELVDRVAAVELNETLNTGGVTQDEIDALTGADTPSADNPFATIGAVDSAIAAAAQETFWYYDFDIDGGAQGTIGLRGPLISVNSFVNAAFVRVITPLTSDGLATVALTTGESAGDIDTAAAFDNAKYGAGFHAVSVHKFMTDDRPPAIVIDVADLTAGKIEILLDTSAGWS